MTTPEKTTPKTCPTEVEIQAFLNDLRRLCRKHKAGVFRGEFVIGLDTKHPDLLVALNVKDSRAKCVDLNGKRFRNIQPLDSE